MERAAEQEGGAQRKVLANASGPTRNAAANWNGTEADPLNATELTIAATPSARPAASPPRQPCTTTVVMSRSSTLTAMISGSSVGLAQPTCDRSCARFDRVAPVVVGGRDGGELDRDHLRRDSQRVRVLSIGLPKPLSDLAIGLDRLDGQPRQLDGQRAPLAGVAVMSVLFGTRSVVMSFLLIKRWRAQDAGRRRTSRRAAGNRPRGGSSR